MDMPGVVQAFFDADRRNHAEALAATFAVGAVVEDEGARHQGEVAIRDWWMEAKRKAQYIAVPIETRLDGSSAFVRAEVSGEFPGSPVTLTYAFTIENGMIARLEIR